MKLVLATPLYPPEIGGPATYAKLLEENLPTKGIEVEVVKFSDARHLPKFIRHVAYYRRLRRALKAADAVLALDPVSVGLPSCLAARRLRKPLFVKVVGDYAWEQGRQRFGVTAALDDFVKERRVPLPVRFLRKVQTSVAMHAKRVIVPSKYLKGIVAAWGVPGGKVAVIYNGIELPGDLPAQKKGEGEFLIVSAGRDVPWKGFDSIRSVAKKHANWRVFIASGLPRPETLGWIKTADVFVLNSRYEGLSHVLIEAMTLGTPVIATSAGGNPTLVEDRKTGLLVPVGDDAALEHALVEVARDPAAARQRARAARQRMGDFSVPRMISATAELLKNL